MDNPRTDFYLWESHCVCHLGARTDRLPSFFLSDSGIIPSVKGIIWIICNRIEVSGEKQIQPYPPVFSIVSKGPWPRKSRESVCAGGHVTGYFAGG